MSSSDLLAWYLLGFIAVHFVFRALLRAAGLADGRLAGRLRRARLHPWRGPALLIVVGGSLVLQLARVPVWVGEVAIFPALGTIWLVSEIRAARWLRKAGASRAIRTVHLARLIAYFIVIVGLGVASHMAALGDSPSRVVAGVAATVATAIVISWLAIRRDTQDQVTTAVRGVIASIEREGNDSAELADRAAQLAEAGKVDEAASVVAPLFDEATSQEPGWGVRAAACRAAMVLATAYARGGNRAGVGAAMDVLERLAQQGLDPVAGITAQIGLSEVVDVLVAAGYPQEAARARGVRAAVSRRTGLPVGEDDDEDAARGGRQEDA